MKMKEIGPRGDARPWGPHPLDPPAKNNLDNRLLILSMNHLSNSSNFRTKI